MLDNVGGKVRYSKKMRENSNVQIVGAKVDLVPYRRKHVEKYHNWMLSSLLLEQTASEPLTLQEEYEMQQKWFVSHSLNHFLTRYVNPSHYYPLAGHKMMISVPLSC